MQIHSLPSGAAVVVVKIEVSPVTLYTKQNSTHKRCFIRHYMQDEMNPNIPNFLKTVGFLQKYSDIKTAARVLILKRAVLNQVFSPPANHSNFRRWDLFL